MKPFGQGTMWTSHGPAPRGGGGILPTTLITLAFEFQYILYSIIIVHTLHQQ